MGHVVCVMVRHVLVLASLDMYWPAGQKQVVSSFGTLLSIKPLGQVEQDEATLNGSKCGLAMYSPTGQQPYRPCTPSDAGDEVNARDHCPPYWSHNVCVKPLLPNTAKRRGNN